MPSLSDDSNAFSATIYIDGKKAGTAKDGGYGGCIDIDIHPKWRKDVEENAKRWLDYLDPNPYDYSSEATIVDGVPKYPRIKASERTSTPPDGYLSDVIQHIVCNDATLKDLKKRLSRACYRLTSSKPGECFRFKFKPEAMPDEIKRRIESKPDFDGWLHEMDIRSAAVKLDHIDELDGPLVLFAE